MKKSRGPLYALSAILIAVSFSFAAGPENVSRPFSQLLAQAPAASVEAVADKAFAPALPAPEALTVRAIEPGTDLTPLMQDRIRVRAILKLVEDVYNGAHLPYSQDGTTFKNKEGKLPAQPVGFYKEYTLLTGNAPHTVVIDGKTYQVAPDLSARGSERVIIGGGKFLYYTPDHYANFILFTVVR